ncbi:MAG: terminase family protein [Deltaproteobacteria bacterium]|nr:terminase family protein [Deltaproteobacteria bacterium]
MITSSAAVPDLADLYLPSFAGGSGEAPLKARDPLEEHFLPEAVPPLLEFAKRVYPRFQVYRHTEALAEHLEAVESLDIERLMVFMPPRHGKSLLTAKIFPTWTILKHPEEWFGITSYSFDLAEEHSRDARAFFRDSNGSLRQDSQSVKRWQTSAGGGIWAAGLRGSITGKGFRYGLVDDPLKGKEEAESRTIRDKVWHGWNHDFRTRGNPGAFALIIQLTRWHHDDLAGRELELAKSESGDDWHIVNFEAIKERTQIAVPEGCTVAPDWRDEGEPLCPRIRGLKDLYKLRGRDSQLFASLFQQRPVPKEGTMFKRGGFRVVDQPLQRATWVRSWDLAGSQDRGKRTAGALCGWNGKVFQIKSVVKGQWATGPRDEVILETASQDGHETRILFEQEPGSGGIAQIDTLVRQLAGFITDSFRPDSAKELRAEAVSSLCQRGMVELLRGDWNHDLIEEGASFPNGFFKDQIDAIAAALHYLITKAPPSDPLIVVGR